MDTISKQIRDKVLSDFLEKKVEIIEVSVIKQYLAYPELRYAIECIYPGVNFEELRWILLSQLSKGPDKNYQITNNGKAYSITVTENKQQ